MSEQMRFEERMSDADALMWTIEKDPLLRSTITAVAVLDRAPDRDRLTESLEHAPLPPPRRRPAPRAAAASTGRVESAVGGAAAMGVRSQLRPALPPALGACRWRWIVAGPARHGRADCDAGFRSSATAVGVHRCGRARRRTLRVDHEDPPRDHRRRRRSED